MSSLRVRVAKRCLGGVAVLGLLCLGGGCRAISNGDNATGVKLLQSGQHEAAMKHFQNALARDPKNPDAYYNLASAAHQLGKARGDAEMIRQAEALYNQCLDLEPDHPECHRGLAVLLVESGRSDRAFTLLKNWVIRNPESADARIELARLYEEFGDKESAQRQLEYALSIDPRNTRLLSALGHLREEQGDYAQALADYQRALVINPHHAALSQKVASLQSQVGNSAPLSSGGTRVVQEHWTPRY